MEQAKEKAKFIDALKAAGGIVYAACEKAGVSRSTYYRWRDTDPDFRAAADEVGEARLDYVEGKLMELINAGDTTATLFYLKTKGKERGWTEKNPVRKPDTQPAQAAPPALEADGKDGADGHQLTRRIKHKKDYIVRLLKKEGKYTAELSMQVQVVAQLLVRTDILAEAIFGDGHRAVNVEYSREGNERESVSPMEKLYLDYLGQSQRALRALGMNTDAKERKTDNDHFADFLSEFKEGTDA